MYVIGVYYLIMHSADHHLLLLWDLASGTHQGACQNSTRIRYVRDFECGPNVFADSV